jgi:hypothetical protein
MDSLKKKPQLKDNMIELLQNHKKHYLRYYIFKYIFKYQIFS